jgi:hypothetical protein
LQTGTEKMLSKINKGAREDNRKLTKEGDNIKQ